jgi:phosphatidylglycerophosphatase A
MSTLRVFAQRVWEWVAKALASGLYISYLPATLFKSRRYTGSGFVGTFWGVILLRWFPDDLWKQLAVWAGGVAIAVVTSDVAEELMGRIDDPRIVIDECVGYWTSILFLPRTLFIVVAGFVLFRVFDVYKLPWVRKSGDLPGGWGVVMDDILAGVLVNILLHATRFVYPH